MSKKKTPPRDVVEKEDRYMGLAWMLASMSKDPSTQVGAIIVSVDNRPLGTGINGPPRGITDSMIDWSRPAKYPFIVHAERNAIDHSYTSVKGSTLYVTGCPCSACMLDMVREGIHKVVYHDWNADKNSTASSNADWETTKEIAKLGNVLLDKYKGNLNWMRDWTEIMLRKGAFD